MSWFQRALDKQAPALRAAVAQAVEVEAALVEDLSDLELLDDDTALRTISRNLSIRKTGPLGFPWHVTCFDCPRRSNRIHFADRIGAVVVNDRGVGNRTFTAAVGAATEHLRAHVEGKLS